jgi:signal peptidase II
VEPAHSHRFRNWVFLFGLTLLLLAVDQTSKWVVAHNLAVGEAWAPIPALARVFTFTHVRNTGVSFGQLPGLGFVFVIFNLIVLVSVLAYYPRIPAGQWALRLASALILTGDLGNVIDRLRTAVLFSRTTGSLWSALPNAYVTDFFDFHVWPVFNVADLCVVSGVVVVGWTFWKVEKRATASDAGARLEPGEPQGEPG